MRGIFPFIFVAVLGAFIQLLLALIFEQSARRWYSRIKRRWWWLRSRFLPDRPTYSQSEFRIENWTVNCIVLEGTPKKPFALGQITCDFNPTPTRLPSDLAKILERVYKRERSIAEKRGLPQFYNGPMVSFVEFSRSRTPGFEDALLHLKFQLTDFYTFLATTVNLYERVESGDHYVTMREKYLAGSDFTKPCPYIATSFGVNLAVVTKDDYLIIGRRGIHGISNYQDQWCVPVCECVNPNVDRDVNGNVDVYKTAKRGAHEELGIDVLESKIEFFSLCVDTAWYLYGLTGLIRADNLIKDDIIYRRTRGIKDKWETAVIEVVNFRPSPVAVAIRDTGGPRRWHPASFTAIVQSLVHEYGQKSVESAFRSIRA
jgi:hypothetical protein